MNYQVLVKAGRGSLETVWEIVWSTLRGVEQRFREGLCLKEGIEDLVQAACIFFIRSTAEEISGLKIIGCGRNLFRFNIQSWRRKKRGRFLLENWHLSV